MPSLCVSREYSADRINAIVNHPEVRPWVGEPHQGYLDLTPIVANPANILLMGEGGGFMLIQQEPGIYEVHSQFLPEARGKVALQAAQDASRYMFTRTDCVEIRTKVPDGNVAAEAFARLMKYELQFWRPNVWTGPSGLVGAKFYAQTLNQWVNTAPGIGKSGHWFHEKLEAAKIAKGSILPVHDDEDAHDRYVGATVEMMASGQIGKALAFYNRWARFAGYAAISLIADNPPVIDIQDALLAIRNDDYEVILCR